MGGEWSIYRRLVNDFESVANENTYDVQMERCSTFWKQYFDVLPNMSSFARYCLAMKPSSAAAERVFSMLENSFTISQMRQSLEDYTEGTVMLQYNKNKVKIAHRV